MPQSDPAVPPVTELQAPARWRTVDFISDLHLQPGEPQTAQLWRDYLRRTSADALFILGDLFEVWVGDDSLGEGGSFEAECAAALREASERLPLFFMVGNRDFLAGKAFLEVSGMQGLTDPTVLRWAGLDILLSHGDALCLDDVDYQRFRAMARSEDWQRQLLAQPLAVRRALAQSMRSESERLKQGGAVYADLDAAGTARWMDTAKASWFIHGHTHRPADHGLGAGRWRIVLSDWHVDEQTRRAEVLRITPEGRRRIVPEAA